MPIHVSLPAQFAELAGGAEEVAVEGATVGAALQALTQRHPDLRPYVWGQDGRANPVVVLAVNGRHLRGDDVLATPLHDGDELLVLSAVEGG